MGKGLNHDLAQNISININHWDKGIVGRNQFD